MITVKGILSFPTLFVPKVAKGSTDAKFGISVLLPAGDPQIAIIAAQVAEAKLNAFPSGYTGTNECLGLYDVKYAGKDYYDPRFSGWSVFSCSAKADDKPSVVDAAHNLIVNPSDVCSGQIGYVSAGISGYDKGTGGIGGWLNGVMITGDMGSMGRLDGKPSVEQMFGAVGSTPPAAPAIAAPQAIAAPPPVAAIAAPAVQHIMTALATTTYEQYIASNWTDEMLIRDGLMISPSFM